MRANTAPTPVTILAAEARPEYVRVLVIPEKFLPWPGEKLPWGPNTPFVGGHCSIRSSAAGIRAAPGTTVGIVQPPWPEDIEAVRGR
ncbi:hypothetical protein GCM10023214_24520 [Amycolatopsis dongchuanensis]|uniref:Uncharacterized protein n=1 Tax=Amycolatopsis dongchuanensis TaxID=1070866 RepID=A0ABP9QEA8_9PSEU